MATIVVGVDGSSGSVRALQWAIEEASVHGDSVKVVKSYWAPGSDFAAASVPELYRDKASDPETAKLQSEEIIKKAIETAGTPSGVVVQGEAVEGHPAEVLVNRSDKARLIVVGSRGLGGFAAMTLGSVSQQVVHYADCPVVIIPALH